MGVCGGKATRNLDISTLNAHKSGPQDRISFRGGGGVAEAEP